MAFTCISHPFRRQQLFKAYSVGPSNVARNNHAFPSPSCPHRRAFALACPGQQHFDRRTEPCNNVFSNRGFAVRASQPFPSPHRVYQHHAAPPTCFTFDDHHRRAASKPESDFTAVSICPPDISGRHGFGRSTAGAVDGAHHLPLVGTVFRSRVVLHLHRVAFRETAGDPPERDGSCGGRKETKGDRSTLLDVSDWDDGSRECGYHESRGRQGTSRAARCLALGGTLLGLQACCGMRRHCERHQASSTPEFCDAYSVRVKGESSAYRANDPIYANRESCSPSFGAAQQSAAKTRSPPSSRSSAMR